MLIGLGIKMAKKTRARTSKKGLSKKGFQFKWWMGVTIASVIAIVGILIIQFSHASENAAVSNQKAFNNIVKDRQHWAQNGYPDANVQAPSANFVVPPKPANYDQTPVKTPPPSKAKEYPVQVEQEKALPAGYPNLQSLIPGIGRAEAMGPPACSTPTRCNIVAWANATLGKKSADFLFPYNEPWCSDYVSWIVRQSGVPFWWGEPKNQPISTERWRIPYSGDIVSGLNYFQLLRDPRTYTPEAGDIVFFFWGNWGQPGAPYDHVGIVTSVTPTTITTVEGNAQNLPNPQTYVQQKLWARNSSNIIAYGRWPN